MATVKQRLARLERTAQAQEPPDDGRGWGVYFPDPYPTDIPTVYKVGLDYFWLDDGKPCQKVFVITYEDWSVINAH